MTQQTTNEQQLSERDTLELLRLLIDAGLVRYEPSEDVNHLRFTITQKGKDYLNHEGNRPST